MADGVSQIDYFGALLLGIGPALAVLWVSLRRFDRPHVSKSLFDDRRVFSSLAVGMVFGVFASALNVLLPRSNLAGSLLVLAVVLFFEELFKLVYLNRRSYQGRFDTTFYGVPLGVGAASTAVVASAVWGGQDFLLPGVIVPLALISLGLSLVNATTGSFIGLGASRGQMLRPVARAVGVRYAHAAFLLPSQLVPSIEYVWGLVSILTALGFATIVYRYAYDEVLPATLPEDVRRQMRRERRQALPVKE